MELHGWFDVHKWNPKNRTVNTPKAEWYHMVTEDGQTFLKTEEVMFGISSLLKNPLLIDDSVVEIELTVTFRMPAKNNHLAGIALSSRTSPAGSDGSPFWKGHKDSGIMAQGYQHSIQHANCIAFQKEGRRVFMSAPLPPFNLLQKTDDWVTWRLLYRHPEKILCFYRSLDEKTPFITQRQVDLSGIVLRSAWIAAWGAEYSEILVSLRNATIQQEK